MRGGISGDHAGSRTASPSPVVERFGAYAHHWFDKVLLKGGSAELRFGYGKLTRPFELYLFGKGVLAVGSHHIPLAKIFREAAVHVFQNVLTEFDPEKFLETFVKVEAHNGPNQASSRYNPSSIEELRASTEIELVSNDCNLCSAYWPLTFTERSVLVAERLLNSPEYKQKNPEIGCDIKLVGTRRRNEVDLLINLPFVANYTPDRRFYLEAQERCKADVLERLKLEEGFAESRVMIRINPQDRHRQDYLTATGSVADTGDVGVVGRGNRANGLITPFRPQSIEAAAGKNPLDHTGKLYTRLCDLVARDLHRKTGASYEVYVNTSKGNRLADPDSVFIRSSERGVLDLASQEGIVKGHLHQIAEIQQSFIKEEIVLW